VISPFSDSSTRNTALGASITKLSIPVDQLPIKSDVLTDVTIMSGISENKIVLSGTSLNCKV